MVLSEGLREENLDADHDDAPLRPCSMDDVVGAATPLRYAVHAPCAVASSRGDEQLYIASAEESATVKQALLEMAWRKAMEEEL
jgi:hypothetical protein